MEFKNVKFDGEVSKSKRTVEGYASVFNKIDQGGDIVLPGAYSKTIRERFKAGKIKSMYNHTYLVGRPDMLKEDEHGLVTKSIISETLRGDEILTLIADGVLTDMSIGYATVKSNDTKRGRELVELKLYEVSFVDFGMNELAEITGMKSITELAEICYKSGVRLDKDSIDIIKKAVSTLEKLIGNDPNLQSSAVEAVKQEITADDLKGSLDDVINWARSKKII
jgi:HK97 family phage prohead protease